MNTAGKSFPDSKQSQILAAVQVDAPKRLGIFKRAYTGRASPRECAKAACLMCCWMDSIAIKSCTDTACPLWRIRPYSKNQPRPIERIGSSRRKTP